MTDPILHGPQAGRCGKRFGYASCSIMKNVTHNTYGPCCSKEYCHDNQEACTYPGVDFREIKIGNLYLIISNSGKGIYPCFKIRIGSILTNKNYHNLSWERIKK